MNELEYVKQLNINIIVMYTVMTVFACISFVIDFPENHITAIAGLVLLLASFIICSILNCLEYMRAASSHRIKFIITFGYLISSFVMMCLSDNAGNFVYIFPFFSFLILFCDITLIITSSLSLVLFNGCAFVFHLFGFSQTVGTPFGHIFTQFVTICLAAIFCVRSVKLLAIKDDIFTDAMNSKYQDSLTGLRNVRFIEDSKNNRFILKKSPKFCIAFIDIDNFKDFNTSYGHSVGDMVLKNVGSVFMQNIAGIPHTYAIRNGGDEFLIISRSMESDDFIALVDKCRLMVEQTNYPFLRNGDKVTMSVGIAMKDEDKQCKTFQELYDLADKRNYEAKKSGRNRIVC